MNWIDEEFNSTILYGWRNDKTTEEIAEELLQFRNYINEVYRIFKLKNKTKKKKSKSKRQNLREEKQ